MPLVDDSFSPTVVSDLMDLTADTQYFHDIPPLEENEAVSTALPQRWLRSTKKASSFNSPETKCSSKLAMARFAHSFNIRRSSLPTSCTEPRGAEQSELVSSRVKEALDEITASPSPKVSSILEQIHGPKAVVEITSEERCELEQYRAEMLSTASKIRAMWEERADAAEKELMLAQSRTEASTKYLRSMQDRAQAARHAYNEMLSRSSEHSLSLSEASGHAEREEAELKAAEQQHRALLEEEDQARRAAEDAMAQHQDALLQEEQALNLSKTSAGSEDKDDSSPQSSARSDASTGAPSSQPSSEAPAPSPLDFHRISSDCAPQPVSSGTTGSSSFAGRAHTRAPSSGSTAARSDCCSSSGSFKSLVDEMLAAAHLEVPAPSPEVMLPRRASSGGASGRESAGPSLVREESNFTDSLVDEVLSSPKASSLRHRRALLLGLDSADDRRGSYHSSTAPSKRGSMLLELFGGLAEDGDLPDNTVSMMGQSSADVVRVREKLRLAQEQREKEEREEGEWRGSLGLNQVEIGEAENAPSHGKQEFGTEHACAEEREEKEMAIMRQRAAEEEAARIRQESDEAKRREEQFETRRREEEEEMLLRAVQEEEEERKREQQRRRNEEEAEMKRRAEDAEALRVLEEARWKAESEAREAERQRAAEEERKRRKAEREKEDEQRRQRPGDEKWEEDQRGREEYQRLREQRVAEEMQRGLLDKVLRGAMLEVEDALSRQGVRGAWERLMAARETVSATAGRPSEDVWAQLEGLRGEVEKKMQRLEERERRAKNVAKAMAKAERRLQRAEQALVSEDLEAGAELLEQAWGIFEGIERAGSKERQRLVEEGEEEQEGGAQGLGVSHLISQWERGAEEGRARVRETRRRVEMKLTWLREGGDAMECARVEVARGNIDRARRLWEEAASAFDNAGSTSARGEQRAEALRQLGEQLAEAERVRRAEEQSAAEETRADVEEEEEEAQEQRPIVMLSSTRDRAAEEELEEDGPGGGAYKGIWDFWAGNDHVLEGMDNGAK